MGNIASNLHQYYENYKGDNFIEMSGYETISVLNHWSQLGILDTGCERAEAVCYISLVTANLPEAEIKVWAYNKFMKDIRQILITRK